MPPAPAIEFDLDRAWTLHPSVSVRPEPFGALLYHFGNRRLSFLKTRQLLDVVQGLAAAPDARTACLAAGVDAGPAAGSWPGRWPRWPPATTISPPRPGRSPDDRRSMERKARHEPPRVEPRPPSLRRPSR